VYGFSREKASAISAIGLSLYWYDLVGHLATSIVKNVKKC